jgi:NADH-quinone oxidoreductase subunit G
LGDGSAADKLQVKICTGTNCFLKGSQHILHDVLDQVQKENLQDEVDVSASFCFEKCDQGPTVSVDGNKIQWCTAAAAKNEITQKLKEKV